VSLTVDSPVSTPVETPAHRLAQTSAPIHPVLAARWSPRSFDGSPIDEQKLTAALEAARWAPSAANTQPARFIVARRGSDAFDRVFSTLTGGNVAWAGSASALIVAVAEVADAEGTPRRWGHYDLGQAIAHLTVQAHADGLHVHQMGGFDRDALHAAFDLSDALDPVAVAAIGTLAEPDELPDAYRERESAPRSRRPLSDFVLVDD